MNRGVSKDDITVWEDTNKGINVCKSRGVNVIDNLFNLDMNFDVIIGNPPYSDRSKTNCAKVGGSGKSLDDVFTLRAMELSDRVKFIIRAKEFTKKNSKFKRQLFNGQHLRSITCLDVSVFPNIQNTVTCVIDWDANYTGKTTITYDDGTVVERILNEDSVVKLNNPDYVDSVDNNMRHRYLRGKMPRHTIDDTENGIRVVEIMGKGDEPIIRTIKEVPINSGCDSYGVIMNYNSSWDGFEKMYVKPYDTAISESVIMLKTDSDEQSARLIEHLQSPEIVELLKGLKSGFSNSGRIFEMIPDMETL